MTDRARLDSGELTVTGLIAELERVRAVHPDTPLRISVNGKRRRIYSVYDETYGDRPVERGDRIVITHV